MTTSEKKKLNLIPVDLNRCQPTRFHWDEFDQTQAFSGAHRTESTKKRLRVNRS